MGKQKVTDKNTERKRTKRLFLWMILTGLVCALLFCGVFLYFFVPRDNDTFIFTVPTFVGLNEQSIGTVSGAYIEREWIYSSGAERGVVISQTPYANARRKIKNGELCKVTIYVSLGEKTERLPDLSGVDELSAAAALRSMGARVRCVPIFGEDSDGCVLYTNPTVGQEIKEGDSVTVFVSRKRQSMPIKVPDFCGLELAEAYRRALSLGLCIADGDVLFLNARVVEQSIPAGARVRSGSYISFRVELCDGAEGDGHSDVSEDKTEIREDFG
jgi:beta-lactam-binding protein with PASTA domain